MDISEVIAPDNNEMVADDLVGSPPRVFTIAEVTEATREGNKRVANIRLEEFPRPWLPSKGMTRVMADNWGRETQGWVGRKVELYGDPDVYFGKEKTGGVRISRLSHIKAAKTTRINPRGGKGSKWTVEPLPDTPTAAPVDEATVAKIAELRAEWQDADEARRAEIQAEVARLQAESDA